MTEKQVGQQAGNPPYKKQEDKDHTIISIDAEKAFEQIQHPFMVKVLQRLEKQGIYLNIIKAVDSQPIANSNLKGEKLKSNSTKLRNKTGHPLFPYQFNIVLQVSSRAIRQLKEIKEIQTGKEEVKVPLFTDNIDDIST